MKVHRSGWMGRERGGTKNGSGEKVTETCTENELIVNTKRKRKSKRENTTVFATNGP